VAAASGAIREFEGALPIRAVERFLTGTLGLGPALSAIFPIVGGLAFAGMLAEVAKKHDPLIAAEKELLEANKALDSSYAELGKRLERLNVEELTSQFGKAAGAKLAAFYSDTNLAEDKARIKDLGRQIDEAQAKLNRGGDASFVPGFFGMWLSQRSEQAARDKIQQLTGQKDFLSAKVPVDERQTSADLARGVKEGAEEAKTKKREANTKLAQDDEEGLNHLKATHELSIGEVIKYWQKRLAVESSNSDRSREITDKLGPLYQESGKAVARVAQHGAELEKQQQAKIDEQKHRMAKYFDDLDAMRDEDDRKSVERATKLADLKTKGDELSTTGAFSLNRLAIQRKAGLSSGEGSTSVAARISEFQQLTAIDQQEAASRISAEQVTIARLKADGLDHVLDVQEHENQIVKIRADAAQKSYEDQTKLMQLVHDEQEKQIEEFRGLIGGLFDAATSHSPNAIPNFVKSQVLNVGKTITENAAQHFLLPAITKLMPTTPGGIMGEILKGTGITKDVKADPLKLSTDLNTTATDRNTAALAALRMQATSRTGGGGGIPSSAGSDAAGDFDPSTGTYSGIGSPPGDLGDGLPYQGSQSTGLAASSLANSGSGFGFNGKTAAAVAGAVGAGFMAAKDFSRGGAKSDIAGVGSVLGGAAGIAALIPGGQVVALGLGIAAAATSLISAVMPDPHVVRENAINKALSQNQYIAPQALNATQDSSGDFTDFDARGNIRTSNFSAIPTVRQGSIWEQTHGLFGGPPTFYNVPGGQTGQFGAPNDGSTAPIINHNYGPGAIQTIDATSFQGLLNKNHMAVGDAASKAMQNGHGGLTTEVQRAANP
jgi:hypothetical protein